MPELLKDIYTPQFLARFAEVTAGVEPRFPPGLFTGLLTGAAWEALPLKGRMQRIADLLQQLLPGTYEKKLDAVLRIISRLRELGVRENSLAYLFLPQFIETYGLDHPQVSLQAMETVTQFASCEFAVRPYILRDPEEVLQQMLAWSRHPSHHVRRFSSEGCRPRLPWGRTLPPLIADPTLILPILQNLKSDPSLYVRKSVANNLNDVSRDHPEVVTGLVGAWKGSSKETDWIIRHGCRTLLRKADPGVYRLFGLQEQPACTVHGLRLSSSRLRIGDRLGFSFQLEAAAQQQGPLRVDYAITYQKAGGRSSRKVFRITEKVFAPGGVFALSRQQRFQDFTTRKHYPGEHRIAIVVNGRELAEAAFLLEAGTGLL